MASVAKPQRNMAGAFKYYSSIARKYSFPVVMVNSVGPCDNFISAGQSAVWDIRGELVGKLEAENEGLMVYDLPTNTIEIFN